MDIDKADALLFDLGGVVIDIDFRRVCERWAESSGGDVDAISERFSFDLSYERHERGEITAAAYFESLRESLEINLTDAQFADGWNAVYVGAITPTITVLRQLQTRVALFAFSNTNDTHFTVCSECYADELSCFRHVFLSSVLGKRKPEPEAFSAVADRMGVAMERILFFDDTLDNIHGARSVGMQAVHVRTPDDVAMSVQQFL